MTALGLHAVGTRVYKDGAPFRHIGVNHFSLFMREFVDFGIPNTGLTADLDAILARGIKVIRVGFGFYDYATWRDYYYNAQAAYWSKLDQVLDAIAARGLVCIVNMAWNVRSFTQLTFLSAGATIGPNRLADKTSALYTLFSDYVSAFVTRYRNHAAVGAWQFGNETSANFGNEMHSAWLLDGTGVDGGATPLPSSCNWGAKPEGGTYAATDKMRPAEYARFFQYLRELIYANDPHARMIISGDAMGNAYAVGVRRANSLAADSYADWTGSALTNFQSWVAYRESELPTVCNHIYPLAAKTGDSQFFSDGDRTLTQHITDSATWAAAAGKPFILEEWGATYRGSPVDPVSTDLATETANFTESLNAIVAQDVPLAMIWNWGGNLGVGAEWMLWDVTHPSRTYQLDAIQAVNATRS
jgi:hypothetical protein